MWQLAPVYPICYLILYANIIIIFKNAMLSDECRKFLMRDVYECFYEGKFTTVSKPQTLLYKIIWSERQVEDATNITYFVAVEEKYI